ncbi:Phenylacetic acid degradation protein OS=Streptomyces aurantiogriseus OX=66870 GN=GCM10010251_90320 PE=4 SV=1 [Streptomyces aurantiogriseus]
MTRLSHLDTVRGLLTLQDPKQFLFFTRTTNGRRAGKEFLARLKERSQGRDKAISLTSYGAQLKAIRRWGLEQPHDLSVIHQHGGIFATLLDSAAGCAVQSTLPQGVAYTSLDLTVKFLRRITVDTGTVRAIGTVVSKGRQTALAQAQLVDGTDRLLAHATSSCMLFPVPPSQG